ncbi:hypothetical protein [Streptomyces sp. NPDC046805]
MEDLAASVISRVLGVLSFVVDMLGVRDWIKGVRRDKRRDAGS